MLKVGVGSWPKMLRKLPLGRSGPAVAPFTYLLGSTEAGWTEPVPQLFLLILLGMNLRRNMTYLDVLCSLKKFFWCSKVLSSAEHHNCAISAACLFVCASSGSEGPQSISQFSDCPKWAFYLSCSIFYLREKDAYDSIWWTFHDGMRGKRHDFTLWKRVRTNTRLLCKSVGASGFSWQNGTAKDGNRSG